MTSFWRLLSPKHSPLAGGGISLSFLRDEPHAACGVSQPRFQLSAVVPRTAATRGGVVRPTRGLSPAPTRGRTAPATQSGNLYTLVLSGGINTVAIDVTTGITQALSTGAPVTILGRVGVYPSPCGTAFGAPAIAPIPIVGTLIGPNNSRLTVIRFSV
jgi:hypothetical protein